jgi:hypothetical protein
VWKQLFHATWKSFRTQFSGILENLRRHRRLVEGQANLAQFEEFQRARVTAEAEFRNLQDAEQRHRRITVRDWLSAANTDIDQEKGANVRSDYPNTGRWLLANHHMQAWLNPEFCSTPLLWLNGIPGAGMT